MSAEYKESYKFTPTLRDILIKSTLSPDVAISEGIQKIDLGFLGEEAEGLLDRSLGDPRGMERSKILYVTPDHKILVQKKDNIGSAIENGQEIKSTIFVRKYPKRLNLPRHENQDRFFAGGIHSHGIYDIPPSAQDFAPLFLNVDSIGIAPMLFVATIKQKIIYFRSKNTPQWDENTVNEKVIHWSKSLQNIVRQKLHPEMSDSQQEGINAVETHNFIRGLRDKYHLVLYSCPIEKNIAIKESA